uniref:(California timema) hypothetical protein n=1 Tax=Timema californicum TaxID=61474 RepID=A0A7R9P929_TIMCA|nr:unnamed protein product [Timema californicum]
MKVTKWLVHLLGSADKTGVVSRVWMYEYRFMTTERFDNLYITNEFIEMDIRRAAKDMETVLPLSRIERRKYIMDREAGKDASCYFGVLHILSYQVTATCDEDVLQLEPLFRIGRPGRTLVVTSECFTYLATSSVPDVVICVQVKSIRLVPAEKLKLAKSAFLLLMGSVKIFTFLAMDYSLYWLMMLIRKHGRFKTVVKAPNMIDVSIEGQGILADLFRIVVKAFKPFGIKLDVDTTECLPDPLEPDMAAYLQILKSESNAKSGPPQGGGERGDHSGCREQGGTNRRPRAHLSITLKMVVRIRDGVSGASGADFTRGGTASKAMATPTHMVNATPPYPVASIYTSLWPTRWQHELSLQNVSLIALCWILMILEPYGLRQRSVIMGYYYPERAKQRSVWLYNRILRSPAFLASLLGKLFGSPPLHSYLDITKVTSSHGSSNMSYWPDNDGMNTGPPPSWQVCWASCLALLPYTPTLTLPRSPAFLASLLGKLFGSQRNKACLLCAHVVREGRGEILVCCPKPDCAGQFCQKCFSDLDNLCTVCLEPVQYGDISDVSIERESSDEDDLRTRSRLDPELGFEEGDPLNYDYQEDYQNDSNEGKPLLPQVSSNTGLLTVRPMLSSTQLFNEPLPDDFEVRRTRTLELLESEDDDITSETGSVRPGGKPNKKKHSKDDPGIFRRFFRFLFQLCCQGKVQDEETARPLLSESPDEVSEDDSGSGSETNVSSDGHSHLATIENIPSERSTSLISVPPTLSLKVSPIFKPITSSQNDPMSSTSTDTPRTVVITKSKIHHPEKPISTLQLPGGSHLSTPQINLNVPSPPSAPSYPPSTIILPSSRKQALGSTFPSSPPKNKPGDPESRTKPKVKSMTSPRDETVRWVAAPKLVLQAGILKRSRGTYYGQSEGSSSSLSVFEQPRIREDLNKMYTNDSEGQLKHELGELKQLPVIKRTEEWVEMSRQMLKHGVTSTDEGFETHPGTSREVSDDLATSRRSSVDVSYDGSSSDIGRLAPIDTYFKRYSTNPDIPLSKQDSNDDTLSEVSITRASPAFLQALSRTGIRLPGLVLAPPGT